MGANVSSSSPFPERPLPSPGLTRPTSLGRNPNLLQPGSEADLVVHRDKKKKMHKFATLRKKLIKTRRHSRSMDYAKVIRELTSNWTIKELNALVEEYDSSASMKDLALAASSARQHANSFKRDLSSLYDYKYCTDVDLVFQGVVFPVHRAILSVRCPRFKVLLAHYPDYGAQIPVQIRTPGVNVNLFSALLRYLYTGEFNTEEYKLDKNMDIIMRLGEEFGPLNALEHDFRELLEAGSYCDAVIIFSSDSIHQEAVTPDSNSESSKHLKHELRCHKAILAARSPFFRSLLLRRARSGEELTERALRSPSRIILDESVIPKRYARVLLTAIYTDTVDLACIVRSSVSMCSLSEVQAMVAGKGHMTLLDEAMEIYQIGQFIDFPILSHGCEDLIAESIGVENLIPILTWSREPHGSHWVHRQALHFLREEFLQIAHSPVLCDMTRDYMIHAVQSDFLQAGELDVLTAVLKWGEHQLMRRMEEREPNLLSHTAHSVTKKGIKKRDLNDLELREIIAELLPHVRTDHVLPTNHEVLTSAIKRGLVSRPPSHMLGDDSSHSVASAWTRIRNTGMFVKPRLFTPYYEEAKSLLEEQLAQVQENEVVRLRMIQMSNVPDMVQYMVEERGYPGHRHHIPVVPMPGTSTAAASVDIIAGTIPVPNPDMLGAMLKRESELYKSKLSERAHALPHTDSRTIAHFVQLRVVREFGLPDSMVDVLHTTNQSQPTEEELLSEARYHTPRRDRERDRHKPGSLSSSFSSHTRSVHHYHLHTVPCQHHAHHHQFQAHPSPCLRHPASAGQHIALHREDRKCPSTPVSPVRFYNQPDVRGKTPSPCDTLLRETMPDIAMATSAMNQLSLQHDLDLPPPAQLDLELDLGDGSNHSHSNNSTLYI